MSIVRPVVSSATEAFRTVVQAHPEWLRELHPLVSYAYLDGNDQGKLWGLPFATWMLDSGAYSVFNSGGSIRLPDYIRTVKRRMIDPRLTEVIALDVINDWRASKRNTDAMWKAGIEAIPVYHHGEPWDVLTGLARDYPMICVAGWVKREMKTGATRMSYASEVFSRVWPCKIHGLGMTSEPVQMAFPFWGVDSLVWLNPRKFGSYRVFGSGMKMPRGVARMDGDLLYLIRLQRKLQARWAKELDRFRGPVQKTA